MVRQKGRAQNTMTASANLIENYLWKPPKTPKEGSHVLKKDKSATKMKLLLIACLSCLATALPNGAPEIACRGMVPLHFPTKTSGENPFILKISATSYKPGDEITGELYSAQNLTFRGFLIEVGTSNEVSQEEEGVGEFIKLDSSIQKHVCEKAGITHINNNDKQRVTFTWKAPSKSAGDLSVRATVVQKYLPSEYWLGAFSERIKAV